MANSKIDENDKPTLTAYNDTTSAPEAIRCDPIFNYLEIYITGTNNGTYTAINNAKIDENENPTLLGYNETTGLLEALRCGSGGELLVKFV